MRITNLEELFSKKKGGNPNGGQGSINWMIHNFCAECIYKTAKGIVFCPRCHGKVRVAPRHGNKKSIYRQIQTEARLRLLKEGYRLQPATIGARTMFGLGRDYK